MKTMLTTLTLLALMACASKHQQTEREPASLNVAQTVTRILPAGTHHGVVAGGKDKCRVHVQTHGNTITISATDGGFNFERDKGSTECMYSRTCFSYSEGRTELLHFERTNDSVVADVKRPGGGPDKASAKKMSLSLKKSGGKIHLTVTEAIGMFNMGTTKLSCEI